jgi:hypothetical protein
MVGLNFEEKEFNSDLSKYAVFYKWFSCDLYCRMVQLAFILHYVRNNEMVLYLKRAVKNRIVLYLNVIVPALLWGNLQQQKISHKNGCVVCSVRYYKWFP